MGKEGRQQKPGVGPEHVDVAMREIDKAKNTVDHGVTQGDQRIDGSERNAIHQLLKHLNQFVHLGPVPDNQGVTCCTIFGSPLSIFKITPDLDALRFSSIEIRPVTPSKSRVAAKASRILTASADPACSIARARSRAPSYQSAAKSVRQSAVFCAVGLDKFLNSGTGISGRKMVGIVIPIGSLACDLDERRTIPTFTTDKWAGDSKLSCLPKNQRSFRVIAGQKNHVRVFHSMSVSWVRKSVSPLL